MEMPRDRQLVTEWQKRIRSYLYGTEVTAQRNFLRRQSNSYGAYGILMEFT